MLSQSRRELNWKYTCMVCFYFFYLCQKENFLFFFYITFQSWIQGVSWLAEFQCTCEVRVYCVATSDVDHILCWSISPEIQGGSGLALICTG